MMFAVCNNAKVLYCTYSAAVSVLHGQCTGGGYYGNGVGCPCNQSSDGGSSGSSLSTVLEPLSSLLLLVVDDVASHSSSS